MISTCLDWNWCHTLGHCVHGGSLTHWLSSRPWSSPARHQTPCQSGLSLQAEERRTSEFLYWESDDNMTCSSHCWLLYLPQTWPCGVFSAWRSTPWLWSQQSLLQSSLSHLSHPLQSDPAGVEGRFFLFLAATLPPCDTPLNSIQLLAVLFMLTFCRVLPDMHWEMNRNKWMEEHLVPDESSW